MQPLNLVLRLLDLLVVGVTQLGVASVGGIVPLLLQLLQLIFQSVNAHAGSVGIGLHLGQVCSHSTFHSHFLQHISLLVLCHLVAVLWWWWWSLYGLREVRFSLGCFGLPFLSPFPPAALHLLRRLTLRLLLRRVACDAVNEVTKYVRVVIGIGGAAASQSIQPPLDSLQGCGHSHQLRNDQRVEHVTQGVETLRCANLRYARFDVAHEGEHIVQRVRQVGLQEIVHVFPARHAEDVLHGLFEAKVRIVQSGEGFAQFACLLFCFFQIGVELCDGFAQLRSGHETRTTKHGLHHVAGFLRPTPNIVKCRAHFPQSLEHIHGAVFQLRRHAVGINAKFLQRCAGIIRHASDVSDAHCNRIHVLVSEQTALRVLNDGYKL